MICLTWNIRGLGLIGRISALISKIRDNNANLVGILETKKEFLSPELMSASSMPSEVFHRCFDLLEAHFL
jgi:hypothetical protein